MDLNSLSGMQQASRLLDLLQVGQPQPAASSTTGPADPTGALGAGDLTGQVAQLIHAQLYYDSAAKVSAAQAQPVVDVQA